MDAALAEGGTVLAADAGGAGGLEPGVIVQDRLHSSHGRLDDAERRVAVERDGNDLAPRPDIEELAILARYLLHKAHYLLRRDQL